MPLITRSIPNLIGGVSQQPEVLRLENQGSVQENGFSGVVEGLKKDHLQIILLRFLIQH